MPFIYQDFLALEKGPLIGTGSCASLIQTLTPGLINVHTSTWRKGKTVVGSTGIVPGTAIATFENGRYPARDGNKHAAFFFAYAGAAIWVVDQWSGDKDRMIVKRRLISPRRPRKDGLYDQPSNSAGAFSVIELH